MRDKDNKIPGRLPITVTLPGDCIEFLDTMREKGYIKSRVVSEALRLFKKQRENKRR
jgi:Arc/MetJ-type ribon-helix-helix transcriptional regulator